MTRNRTSDKGGLDGIIIVLMGSVLLPVALIGLVLLLGQDWANSDEARRADYVVIGAVVLIFASDWIRDRPVWQRFPRWLRQNPADIPIFVCMAAYIGWQDADATLTGAAWWWSFGAEFLMMLIFFSAFYVLWTTIGHLRLRRKQRKSAE